MACASQFNLQKVPIARHKSCPTLLSSSSTVPSKRSLERDTSCPTNVPLLPKEHSQERSCSSLSEASPTSPVLPVAKLAVEALACVCSTTFFAVQCQALLVAHTALAAAAHNSEIAFASCHASHGTDPSSQCTLQGIDEVIQLHHLHAYAKDIGSWCDDMGAADLEEVAEAANELCNSVRLPEPERRRLLAWAAAFLRSRELENVWGHGQHDLPPQPGRVHWASHVVSVAEFCVEEDEHLSFQFIIESSVPQVTGIDETETDDDGEGEYGSHGDCTSLKRHVSSASWKHALASDEVDTDADSDAGDTDSTGTFEEDPQTTFSLVTRW